MVITKTLSTKHCVLEFEPEELALCVLGHFVPGADKVHQQNFLTEMMSHYGNDTQVERAFAEAWSWLLREGLLVEGPGGGGWCFISRRGQRLRDEPQDWGTFQRSNILPKKSLHPTIAVRVWSNFIRGEYDTAVFQGFKEVEVAVRSAGGFLPTDIGQPLMSKAFNVSSGPLADLTLPEAERLSMLHLFMGAMGMFKNPASHRHVALNDPMEAAEMISFASLLMRIVDVRAAARSSRSLTAIP